MLNAILHQVSIRVNSVSCPCRPWLTLYFGGDFVSSESEKNLLAVNLEDQQQVVQRSRWQAVLLEAGGIGAAVSEESMRRLKYCLQWLQVRDVAVFRTVGVS